MRAVLGWVCDPYIHVFLVGLLLVRLAMGVGSDEPVGLVSQAIRCEACAKAHDPDLARLHLVHNASGHARVR